MNHRTNIIGALALIAILLFSFSVASGKVSRVTIERAIDNAQPREGDVIPVYRPTLYLTMLPVKLASQPMSFYKSPPDSTVFITVYIAEGADPAPESFRAATVERQKFAEPGPYGRIDEGSRTIGLNDLRGWIPEGIYSIYVTVDDGDGPSPPSNIVKVRVYDWSQRLERPRIASIESPASGVVILTLDPIVTKRMNDTPTVMFSINWARGERASYDGFEEIRLEQGGIPNAVYISRRKEIDMKHGRVILWIDGVRPGRLSFYVKIADVRMIYTEPSDIVTVDVKEPGSYLEQYAIRIMTDGRSGVAEDRTAGEIDPIPNPASSRIHLPTSGLEGALRLRLADARGAGVIEREVIAERGGVDLDISDLPPGVYIAELRRGATVRRMRFVIAR